MKTYIRLLAVSFAFIISSCTKNAPSTTEDQLTQARINQVNSIQNKDLQKIAYSSLSVTEKYSFWVDHIQSERNTLILDKNQRQIVDNVISALKPEIWTNEKSMADFTNSTTFIELEYQIKKYIPQDVAKKLFGSYNKTRGGSTEDYPIECVCNEGSWFDCDDPRFSDCSKQKVCEPAGNGCGFAGLFKCNGDCFETGVE